MTQLLIFFLYIAVEAAWNTVYLKIFCAWLLLGLVLSPFVLAPIRNWYLNGTLAPRRFYYYHKNLLDIIIINGQSHINLSCTIIYNKIELIVPDIGASLM